MKKLLFSMVVLVIGAVLLKAQTTVSDEKKLKIENVVRASVPEDMNIGQIKVQNVLDYPDSATMTIDLSENYADVPFTVGSLNDLRRKIIAELGTRYNAYTITLTIDGTDANDLFPLFKYDLQRKREDRFITSMDSTDHFSKGLDGNVIAMWQSHGWYFEQKLNRWEWQRARIFQTVEDLYTQSYVMPFLMPMLENAGAYIISPRERDVNTFEQIVDNDGGLGYDGYEEHKRGEKWKKSDSVGFAYTKSEYEGFANPFKDGTYRIIKTTKNRNKISTATWSVDVPADGDYAVYISYATLATSVPDAAYKINSTSGTKTFIVNQKMGGGTWIYLGHFPLKKGINKDVVELSNFSLSNGVITADAVKIGGGMGNIARKVELASATDENSQEASTASKSNNVADYRYQLSRHPRYTEGARYFLQWAGVPDSVYSPSKGQNDYTDDYRCRGEWVNYLAGGSKVLKGKAGLNIPVDLAFAFHSDAGTTMNDDIIGTLGIYYTDKFKKYNDGTPRILSRDLTNKVMTNIVTDVRKQYEPDWTRRGMWDKSYYEARVPEVPTMLLELLSHQNFADMKYGLNPEFRFTVSRAIYKGMLQFLAQRDGRAYVVQPLPVNSFAIRPVSEASYMLTWLPTADTLCANADASKYEILERVDDGAFKRIAVTTSTQYLATVTDHLVHSYKVVAMNDGGRSFPSEILSLGVAKDSKGTVLVVNGFTRVSGPDTFDSGKMAGFYDEKDHGVPYIKDISFIGSQFEFRRNIPWMDDDAAGFGASRSNYETKLIAGNTFDYPALHGKAIMDNGYSFVSSSAKGVLYGGANLKDYKYVDFIFGKQKEIEIGRGVVPNRFKIFTPELMSALTEYLKNGGNLMISGSFIASDIWDKENINKEEKEFAQKMLGYNWRVGQASVTGEVYAVPTMFKDLSADGEWKFNNELNDTMYVVESPDALYPYDTKTGATVLRYKENNIPAGVASAKDNFKTFVIGFPFETIKDESSRGQLMGRVLNFFSINDK